MKVGNTINGLKITDVKRVNKLNLIQFLKEVDSYLQQGYNIDVNSARQVGLVLQTDMFKTEAASSVKVGSTERIPTEIVGVTSKEVEPVSSDTSIPEPQSVVTESTVQSTNVEETVESAVDTDTVNEEAPVVEEQSPLTAKKTTTRSKKTVQ